MALLYPPIENIKKLKVQPTPGEYALINFLIENLDNTYEIFFQPYLNGDRPDVIIMRKNSGVMIIEVKDWRLRNYYLDDNLNWKLKENNAVLLPPYKQVLKYKQNLFTLHIEELNDLYNKDRNIFGIISCALYFHNEKENDIKEFHRNNINPRIHYKYLNDLNYFEFLGNDSLNPKRLKSLLSKRRLNRDNNFFTDNLCKSFKRYLQPPYHYSEDGKDINYTQEQLELSRSEQRPRRKVKGIAGCGKTLVLAKRAVNAYKRTGKKILILTYNLSLVNYIHDRISDVKEDFSWDVFEIINYHQFFIAKANEYSIPILNLEDFDNPNFFVFVKDIIEKYDVIFVDEIQDYKTEWQRLIHDYFLKENGEYCVFGDEKQNIYNRDLDTNKEPITVGITGPFNRSLNKSFRFAPNLTHLADNFQKVFFKNKYDLDSIDFTFQSSLELSSKIRYYYFNNYSDDELIVDAIYKILNAENIHSSDVATLCSKVERIRNLEYLIREKKHEKTEITFETKEEYNELFNQFRSTNEKGEIIVNTEGLNLAIDEKRRFKKIHFWNKSGTIKLSTIHSYKGWEIHTMFLILEDESENNQGWTVDELIYTAITRCRFNLYILNLSNKKYDAFFNKFISDKEVFT